MEFTRKKKEDQTVGDYLMYCYKRDIHNDQMSRFNLGTHSSGVKFRPPTDFFNEKTIHEGNIKLLEQKIEGLQSQIIQAQKQIEDYLVKLMELQS